MRSGISQGLFFNDFPLKHQRALHVNDPRTKPWGSVSTSILRLLTFHAKSIKIQTRQTRQS